MPAIDAPWLAQARLVRRLAGRNRTKADILVYRHGPLQVAVKDYRARSWLVRQLAGRLLISRETRAYEAAGEIEGLAPFLGRVGPFALATEWVEGRPLAAFGRERPDPGCFEQVRQTLDRMHGRGVALGDLHIGDVLVDSRGGTWMIDLATAMVLGARPGRLRRWMFGRLLVQDEIGFVRMRARFTGQDVDAAVDALGPEKTRWYRRARRIKGWIDVLRGRGRRPAR